MKSLLRIIIFSLALGSTCRADDVSAGPVPGANATTTTSVSVRETPPAKQLIGISAPGRELFTLAGGTAVHVLSLLHVRTFAGTTDWIQISVKNAATNQVQQGWCFLSSGDTNQFKFP